MVILRGEREVVVMLSLLATEMRRNAKRLDNAYFLWHMMGCKDILEFRFVKIVMQREFMTGNSDVDYGI